MNFAITRCVTLALTVELADNGIWIMLEQVSLWFDPKSILLFVSNMVELAS